MHNWKNMRTYRNFFLNKNDQLFWNHEFCKEKKLTNDLCNIVYATECVTDLEQRRRKMITFGSNYTTLKLSIIFWVIWGRTENFLEPKTKSPYVNLA